MDFLLRYLLTISPVTSSMAQVITELSDFLFNQKSADVTSGMPCDIYRNDNTLVVVQAALIILIVMVSPQFMQCFFTRWYRS